MELELEGMISIISDAIGEGWKFLARSLQFSETDVQAIEYADPRNLREQIYQLFYQWKQRVGNEVTTGTLWAALYDAELNDVIEKLNSRNENDGKPPSQDPVIPIQEGTPVQEITRSHDDNDSDGTSTPPPIPPPAATADTNVVRDSGEQHTPIVTSGSPTLAQNSPTTTESSPTVARGNIELRNDLDTPDMTSTPLNRSTSANVSGNDLSVQDETEREYVRRKRIEKLSNRLNNSDPSNQSLSPQRSFSGSTATSSPTSPPAAASSTNAPRRLGTNASQFEVNDAVMVERKDAAPWYGVVRWIGELPESPNQPVIGIEMENEVPGGNDGSSRNGVRLFQCQEKHGIFLPARMVKHDNRFDNTNDSSQESNMASNTPPDDGLRMPFPLPPGWRSPEEVLKQMALNIPMVSPSSNTEANNSGGEERVLVFTVPADHAGLVIGQGGRNIQAVERETNTIIKMEREYGSGLGGIKRGVIRGSEENQKRALQMILGKLEKKIYQHTAKTEMIRIPGDKVGLVIGRGGQTKRAIITLSGVLDIDIKERPPGLESFSLFAPQTRDCTITGSEKDIEKAKTLIDLAVKGRDIVVGATLAALISDLANLGVTVEEQNNS